MTAKLVYECDEHGCDEELETDTTSFTEASEQLRDANWTTRRGVDGWEHFCSDHKPTPAPSGGRRYWERD